GITLQYIGLVDTCHAADAVPRRPVPTPRELEGTAADPEGARPRDHQGVRGHVAADPDTRPPRGIEALGVLAKDDVVDPLAVGETERARDAGIELDRPEPQVEVEDHPERELGRELGAIGKADVGQPRRAEEDGVGGLADLERLARKVLAGPPVAGRARLDLLEGEAEVLAVL